MARRFWLGLILLTPVLLTACAGSSTSSSPTSPTSQACVYTLGTTTLNMAGVGGTATIGVTTNAGCAWTAASSGSFVNVTSAASNSGPGTASLAVAENTGDSRSATLTVAGQTVTVNQAAGDPVFGNWAGTIVKGAGCPAALPASAAWSGTIRRNAAGNHEFLINIPSALVFNQAVSLQIIGNAMQFAVAVDTLYTFNATLAADRRSFTGTFSGGSCSGTWSGTRQ
ncbi:MAG: BACON domain-containing protein [Acidobacteriota bacterium]|nr:BACON domain-containing protein [Acidobacteriota bacterium]